ncbi:hypothetical protein SETIT_7G294900v2 [Setaria italica]|uniref:Zinc finger PHD-type domain-containing protein n=2 Tax=Setaria italica TaxID=4555 RepID=A0A368S2Q3_SETIT|nr:uncharacterized protein LOC101784120 [Setaria italica]RCV36130.1 hypothetical protein SETIT_7G294900v2 [Setaria italica]
MNIVCEVCGDAGFKHLLLSCSDCKGAHTHQYCLDKILYDASSVDWFCKECHQRHSEGSYIRSLGKVSIERPSSHIHFVTTSQHPITKRLESARVFSPRGQRKSAYVKKKYSSRMNYLQKKCIRKNSNMGGMGISRRQCRDASIASTSVNALHSCETIGTETTKNKDRNEQVDNEKSVQSLNNDRGSNYLKPGLKQINHLKPHDNISSEPPQSQTAPFKGFFMKTKKVVSGSKESLNPRIEEGNSDREKSGDKSKCMDERKILAEALDYSNESELSNMNECSLTCEVDSKAGNKPSDETLVSHQVEDRRGELMIASPQNSLSGDADVTHCYSDKKHDSLIAKESLNHGSAPEHNRTGQSDLQSNIRKISFSFGKVAANQVSGLKDGSGTILSSKHSDHDKQTNAPVICKNMEDKFVKDNRTVVGAQNMYCARNKDKPDTHGDKNSNVLDDLMFKGEKKKMLDHEVSMVAANGPQPFTPQNGTFDKAMSDLSIMGVLPKENNCLPSMRIENDNVKENHSGPSKLLNQDNSSSSLEISSEAIALKASATEVEISDDVDNFGKDKPRKRRRLILDDDDEVDEEKAEDVQKENVNPQPPKCDEPMTKHRVDTEYFVEETVQTGELNDQNLINGRLVKRRRRYIAENEDEEDIVGSDNVECALNDATNQSLNDGANMVPQTLVATGHSQQSRPSHSEYDDQEYYIYSQPLDEPVWSGVFKIDTEVLMLDAHLSSKACERVRELSASLQSVVEVKKLPRSQAWPKSWKSFGPTDDNIGLFFFPNSSRQNEVSNRLVNGIIKSDGALKVAVGMAELLIFPSSLLPEQYHFFQGNHYLWGVFRRRKDMADETVLGKEQDGSVNNAAEQGQLQEPDLLNQRDEALYESSDQETCAVKHVVHIENQLLVECDHEAEKEAAKAATSEGTTSPGSSWSSAKMNSPKVGSNCCVEPRNYSKLDAHGDLDQQEDFTSLPANASSITEQSSDSGPAAVSTKLIKPVEHGHGQPHSGSEPSTRKLFGFVTARTPRSQQLIQEMVSEGALLFPVPEEVVTTGSITGISTRVVSSEMNPDTERLHLSEPPQAFDFVSMGHCEPGADSEACLELFPVRQEHIGWAPKADVSREVDLDLSLGKQSRAPSLPPLL